MVCERCGGPRGPETKRFCSKLCANRSRSKRSPVDRFWPKVHKTEGCWEWTGAAARRAAWFGANPYRPSAAYRFSWVFHNGRIPNGLMVCHRCDNPMCVRPDHLFLGTQLDNMRDAKAKGRVFNLGQWVRDNPERAHSWKRTA